MGKKTVADLVQEAAEAVKGLPEHLQEVAFSKAFEALSEGQDSAGNVAPGRRSSPTKRASSKSPPKPDMAGDDERAVGLDQLNRTSHPEIGHGASGLDNALRLLVAARDDLGIDGLSAAEIAATLTEKFRARITRQAVGQALNGAGRYVDRRKEGSAVRFRIMGPGEDYLRERDAGGESATPAKPKKARRGQRAARKTAPKKKGSPTDASGQGANAKTRTRGSASPATDFAALLDTGFLETPRRVGELVDEIRDRTGRRYKSRELSAILLRQLRSGSIVRKRNGDGQYEYSET